MSRTSSLPSLVDIRCMASPDLLGMARFCVDELKRLSVSKKRQQSELAQCSKLLGLLRSELGARCVQLG